MAALGTKAKLLSSALSIDNDLPSRLKIVLATQETAFSK
jgi:hypothetical protein